MCIQLVTPITAVWAKVRDDKNKDVDWVLIGYDGNSKTDMTVLESGSGGMEAISGKLPQGIPVFGGVRLSSGRFVHFLYVDDNCPALKRGRTLMYKNGAFMLFGVSGRCPRRTSDRILTIYFAMAKLALNNVGVFNALKGCDGEIEMSPGLTEAAMGQVR
jgi:hypothetical protein